MKKKYITFYSLKKYKYYNYINILGLGLCLACVITLLCFIYQELNTDHFIEKLDRVHLVMEESEIKEKKIIRGIQSPDSEELIHIPEIEKHSRFISLENKLIETDSSKYIANILATDSIFLQIMTYPVIQAQSIPLLRDSNEAVITRKFARQIFGNKNPLGKTIRLSDGKKVVITGILGPPHTKISYPFDLLIAIHLLPQWNIAVNNLIQLCPEVRADEINHRFLEYKKVYTRSAPIRYQLYPFKNFYFDNDITCFHEPAIHGNQTNLKFLWLVIILLILTGCFNFINIYTVLVLKREQEFRIKKVFGANSFQIYSQMLAENICMVTLALFLAWTIHELLAGLLWNSLEIPVIKNLTFNIFLSIGILIILPPITSFYPFIRYCYSYPNYLTPSSHSSYSLKNRNLLLFIQYSIVFTLSIFSLFSFKQLHFLLNIDPGFNIKDIAYIEYLSQPVLFTKETEEDFTRKKNLIKDEFTSNPLLKNHSFMRSPFNIRNIEYFMRIPGEEFKPVQTYALSKESFDFWGFTLLKGKVWDEPVHPLYDTCILINETAWNTFQLKDLENSYLEIAENFVYIGIEEMTHTYQVIGVVKDFYINHFGKEILPMIIFYFPFETFRDVHVYIPPEKKQETLQALEELNKKVHSKIFSYHYISEKIKGFYKEEKEISLICSLFALISIGISGIGLFSLSLFDIRQKMQEVAIRKVNGATPAEIVKLFMRKYLMTLSIAFCTGSIIGRMGLYYYLRNFVNNAAVSFEIFLLAFLITGTTIGFTLIFQIRKAAFSNPSKIIDNKT